MLRYRESSIPCDIDDEMANFFPSLVLAEKLFIHTFVFIYIYKYFCCHKNEMALLETAVNNQSNTVNYELYEIFTRGIKLYYLLTSQCSTLRNSRTKRQ